MSGRAPLRSGALPAAPASGRRDVVFLDHLGLGQPRVVALELEGLGLLVDEDLLLEHEARGVVEEPERVQSNFVRGYSRLMVKLTPNS